MDRLRAIQVFVEVAQAQSFTLAAQRLGMSRANVTKQISALESLLGARLLNRNTQHVALTEAGLTLFSRGVKILHNFEEIEEELGQKVQEPRGMLRIGVPSYYGTSHLVRAVAEFQRLHREISVTLQLDMGDQNLIRDGLDLSIRIATSLKDTNDISRFLVRSPQVLVAAPAYLAKFGHPKSPVQLANHNCLVHTIKSPTGIWQFRREDGVESVQVDGTLKANFGEALKSAALLGEGISMHPTYMVDEEIRSGQLEVVLPAVEVVGVEIYALYPHKENLPARVRLFIEFLKRYIAGDPKYRAASERITGPDQTGGNDNEPAF